jgi:hypothetical protein
MDESKTSPTHLGSCRYLDLCRGVLDLSIIQQPFSITKCQTFLTIRNFFIAVYQALSPDCLVLGSLHVPSGLGHDVPNPNLTIRNFFIAVYQALSPDCLVLGSLHVPSGLGHDVVGGVDAARDAAALCSGTATRLVQGVLDGAGAVLLGMLPPRAPYVVELFG